MNTLTRASVAAAFAAASLAAGAQTSTRLTDDGHNKTLIMNLHDGGSYAFRSGSGDALAQTGQNTPPVKDDLFAGVEQFAKNAVDATEITMDPDSLDMVKGPDGARAHHMVLNVVRTYRFDKPGMYNMADVDAYRNKLNTGDWHCSVHVREMKKGASTDVCERHRTDGLREHAIITAEPQELTFIHTIKRDGGPGGHSELGIFRFGLMPGALQVLADLDLPEMLELPMQIQGLLPLEMSPLKNLHPFGAADREFRERFKDPKVFKYTLPDDGANSPSEKPKAPEKPKE